MKIVINAGYGNFQMSKSFYDYYNIPYTEIYGVCWAKEKWTNDMRRDPRLIEYIEKFGSKVVSGPYTSLEVVEIPKGTKYYIDEYDGAESIVTEDDIKWEVAD